MGPSGGLHLQIRYEKIFEKNLCTTLKMQGGDLSDPGVCLSGPKIYMVGGGSGGATAASGCFMVDSGDRRRGRATVWTGAGEGEAGAWTERWRLPWSGRPETAQNER